MSPERIQGGCVAVPSISHSSSFSKCNHSHSSPSDDSTCGTPVWRGKGLTCVCFKGKGSHARVCINLTPLQASSLLFSIIDIAMEERLKRLRHRTKVQFDASRPEHQEALRALWYATYPDQELQSLVSDQWKQMGWQGRDPSTDFRLLSFIERSRFHFFGKLAFFCQDIFDIFSEPLDEARRQKGNLAISIAVAGVNITFMIMQMLDIDAKNEWAFDLLYCVAFMIMDKLWLEKNATYMEFNDILKSTRSQLEKELLMDDVLRIEDMPSYSLLY
ncbi:UNVERIFIED_CONTAM: ELMO domain-containing protein A [Sesamum angustifolium]|uniref:ELMO domain-containing protein A n=1 Tax=Sesamum angustifolium TaxID=2727405 RepID=A0AAW2M8E5_9LAMI